ncbi:MAG: hypothetical protein ACI8P0_005257 [Planctomycetaceae bacterium]|jgi:hypothetical protein
MVWRFSNDLFLVPTLCVGTDSLDAPRPGSTKQSSSTPDAERHEWRPHAERRNEQPSVQRSELALRTGWRIVV